MAPPLMLASRAKARTAGTSRLASPGPDASQRKASPMPKTKAALFYDYPLSDGEVFGQGRRERIAGLTELYPEVVSAATFERHAPELAELE